MQLHLPFPRAASVRRAFLALAACAANAACAASQAGTPAADQGGAADAPVPITMPVLAGNDAIVRLMSLYPPAAREAGITHGSASLKFRVMVDGTVDTASIVVERQTRPEFVQPAKEWVAGTRFRPATVGGRPVDAWIRDSVYFQEPVVMSRYEVEFHEPPVLLNGSELPGLVRTHYPPALRDAGVAGSVLVRMDVSATGEPAAIQVQLTTDPALEEPALAIARMLRFRPARLYSRAVKGQVMMPLHFGPVPAL